jgi:hypothetical protein
MIQGPVDKCFGIPMSDWIERLPNELGVDAVGLWQIVPVGVDSFGLSGAELEDFTHQCILALLRRGAVPVRAAAGAPGWVTETAYQGSQESVANQIVNEWRNHKLVPDHDGLWFWISSDLAPKVNK